MPRKRYPSCVDSSAAAFNEGGLHTFPRTISGRHFLLFHSLHFDLFSTIKIGSSLRGRYWDEFLRKQSLSTFRVCASKHKKKKQIQRLCNLTAAYTPANNKDLSLHCCFDRYCQHFLSTSGWASRGANSISFVSKLKDEILLADVAFKFSFFVQYRIYLFSVCILRDASVTSAAFVVTEYSVFFQEREKFFFFQFIFHR